MKNILNIFNGTKQEIEGLQENLMDINEKIESLLLVQMDFIGNPEVFSALSLRYNELLIERSKIVNRLRELR